MQSITKSPDIPLCAVIDVGTNTLRLLIGLVRNGELVRLYSDRNVTRLGKDLISTHRLNRESVDLSIASLLKFKEKCDQFGVAEIIAIGTSALRDAKDGMEFLKSVKDRTGISINIISGETEAELTLKGIKSGKSGLPESKYYVVVDIGGGSTEIVIGNDHIERMSFNVGAVKIFECYIRNDPPIPLEIRNIQDFLAGQFKSLSQRFLDQPCRFIATGGTPTTIGSIHLGMRDYDGNRIHGLRLSYSSISAIYERLRALPLKERISIAGLERERADIIIPGTMIIMSLLRVFHASELIVSDYGLMEGALYDAC